VREIRIYQPGDYQCGQLLELTPEAGQHVAVVLRMQPGERITLFCGTNREYSATIERVKKKAGYSFGGFSAGGQQGISTGHSFGTSHFQRRSHGVGDAEISGVRR
jgi:hypothetical protein